MNVNEKHQNENIQIIMHSLEIVEESLSLEKKEVELIQKALKRHNGKRKLAALDLGERTGLFRLFDARREFSNAWNKFLNPINGQQLEILVDETRFPYIFYDKTIAIHKIGVVAHLNQVSPDLTGGFKVKFIREDGETPEIDLKEDPLPGVIDAVPGLLYGEVNAGGALGKWVLSITKLPDSLKKAGTDLLNPALIENIGVIVYYTVS